MGCFRALATWKPSIWGTTPVHLSRSRRSSSSEGDNGVVVKVAEGAPFNMSVTLNFKAGTLSSNLIVSVNGGDLDQRCHHLPDKR